MNMRDEEKRVTNIRHTGLVVTNMDQALRFYRDLLGIDKVVFDGFVENEFLDKITATENARIRAVMLEAEDGNRVELLQYLSHPAEAPKQVNSFDVGCSHLAVQVKDLDGLYRKMLESGVRFNAPPQVDPNGYAKVTYCHDFDGTIVELVQILDESNTTYNE